MAVKQEICYLSLGSNIGDCIKNIETAIELLNSANTKVIQLSSFYKSEAWGFESKNSFINCCVSITTTLSPMELLVQTQIIEKEIGRTEKSNRKEYTDRIIDIDLIFFGDKTYKSIDLMIPHPHFHERNFVLLPLYEIAPNFLNPMNKLTVAQQLINSKDNNNIVLVKKC